MREIGKRRHHLAQAKGKRRVDPEDPARLDHVGSGGRLSLLDLGKDAFARGQMALAGLGQRELAGGAEEQAGAEPVLQRVDMLGRHGWRHAERAGGGGKTSQGRDLGEDLHSGETVEHAISHLQ